jgi:hypothetical protein
MGHTSSELRGFGRGRDVLQPHHPFNIAVFVNGFPILIRLRAFKLDRFIADTAFRWSQFVDKSQERWHCSLRMQNRQIANATRAEGRGGEIYKRLLPYTTVGHARGVRQLQYVGYGTASRPVS